jgi:hypothetical protein
MTRPTTQARVRSVLREIRIERHERCSHLAAEQTGAIVARQLPDGNWLYSAPYYCPACDLHFTEKHAQRAARNS